MSKNLRGSLILLLAAIIWGAAFVAQDKGGALVGAFTFNASRWIIGAVFLLPITVFFTRKKGTIAKEKAPFFSKNELLGGSICGILLFVSSSFQQFGISLYDSGEAAAGKSGFITALYIVLVPLFGLFAHKKVPVLTYVSIAVAITGMYLLCIKDGFSFSAPDILIFLCALSFTFHILTVDAFSDKANGLKVSVIQMIVCGIISLICMFIFETPKMTDILNAAIPILYAGILSSGVAYTLQILGQKDTNPSVAAVIMSLESVFAALTGAMFGERMSGKEILGGALMFLAVLLAQAKLPKKEESK